VQTEQGGCYLSTHLSVSSILDLLPARSLISTDDPADVISDAILIVAPLQILNGLLDKVLRRRLLVIFSTCIATTVVSLVHAAYIITDGGTKIIIAALVEVIAPTPRNSRD
jgi:hypothetical protein